MDKLSSGTLRIDHWPEKATAQAQLRAEIIKHLFAQLPPEAYDADEIKLKANAVFAHIYTAGLGEGARVRHQGLCPLRPSIALVVKGPMVAPPADVGGQGQESRRRFQHGAGLTRVGRAGGVPLRGCVALLARCGM